MGCLFGRPVENFRNYSCRQRHNRIADFENDPSGVRWTLKYLHNAPERPNILFFSEYRDAHGPNQIVAAPLPPPVCLRIG